tara:strand:+ start:259 stop:975 length:717 start_codon:yes stop_codon:yes gene_type:complete
MAISAKVSSPVDVKVEVGNTSATKSTGLQNVSKVNQTITIDASDIPITPALTNSSATNVRDALNEFTNTQGSQVLQNKTIDADNNTISNLEVDNFKSGVLDTDLSSVASTDTTLPSAKAVKTYVDNVESTINASITAQDLDFQADTGGALNIDLDSETLTIAGGTGIDTTGSGNQVSVAVDSTIATKTYVDTQVAGVNTIEELSDTNISSVSDDSLLQYDNASEKWINVTEISGGTFI